MGMDALGKKPDLFTNRRYFWVDLISSLSICEGTRPTLKIGRTDFGKGMSVGGLKASIVAGREMLVSGHFSSRSRVKLAIQDRRWERQGRRFSRA